MKTGIAAHPCCVLLVFFLLSNNFALAQNIGHYPLPTSADAYVDQENPNATHGSDPHLFIGRSPEFGYSYRIFIKFDLSVLPDDAVVQSADLYMYMYESSGVSPVNFRLCTVKESWSESTIKWNNIPDAFNPFLYADVDNTAGWKIFNIAQPVRGWLKGTYANNGILIYAVDPGNTIFQRSFYSSESANCGAYVLVTYTTGTVPPLPPDIPLCRPGHDHTPPTLSIIADPNPATTSDLVTVTAEADDGGSGVYRVQLLRGGTLLDENTSGAGQPSLSASDAATLAAGVYTFSALAYDREMNGVSASLRLQVYQDGRPPAVNVIHSPLHPAVNDLVTFTATAEDESGVSHLTIALDENFNDYHYSPARNSVSQSINYRSPGARVLRYRASASDAEGFYGTTGTKYILFGNDGTDTDGDHLSDEIEDLLGLDPYSNDTDRDGLYDNWEVLGFDADGDGDIDVDLPGMGASPHQKDVFLEIDWMEDASHSHMLHPWAIQYVVNVYREYGIQLHVDSGNLGGGNAIAHQEVITDCVNDNEYAWLLGIKAANFDRARCGIFYYCTVLHTKPCGSKSLGTGNIILRTCDSPVCYSSTPANCCNDYNSPARQAMLLFHELGHGMGLGHGGVVFSVHTANTLGPEGTIISETLDWAGDDENDKPNYLSNMNYRYQWDLKLRTDEGDTVYVLAYNNNHTWLDETDLDEPEGYLAPANLGWYLWRRGDDQWHMYRSRLSGTFFIRPMKAEYRDASGRPLTEWFLADGSPIDWNFDGDATDRNLAYDTNEHQNDAGDWVESITVMEAQNEIPLLRPKLYGDIYAGFTLAKEGIAAGGEEDFNYPPELERDGEYCDGIDNDGDGVIDEGFDDSDNDHIPDWIDNAPYIANPDQADIDGDYIGDAAEAPPGVPRSLSVVTSKEAAVLKWGPPADGGNVIGYNVYRRTCKETEFRRMCASFPSTLYTSFEDSSFTSGVCGKNATYEYAVSAVDLYMKESRMTEPVSVVYSGAEQNSAEALPAVFALLHNYPNPFNPVTHIRYQLPGASHVDLRIFNSLGQEVAVLVDRRQSAGYYELDWDGSVSGTGLYFIQFIARDTDSGSAAYSRVEKMVLVK